MVRSEPFDRGLYATLLVCFLGLILTALPLKFSNQPWAEVLARNLGGFRSTSMWHHFFAAVAMVGCAIHIVRGIAQDHPAAPPKSRVEDDTLWTRFACPDSPGLEGPARDGPVVSWTGTATRLRTLDLLGKVRLLGRLSDRCRHRDLRTDALVSQLVLHVSCRARP